MRRSWILAIVAAGCLLLWQGSAAMADDDGFPVPPPPFEEDYFPCMENCHSDMDTNTTPRELEDDHNNIKLHHADQFRWCLDCHDDENRDMLRLQSGEKITFEVSYRLCGQCHGDKYRDWRKGIHGKRTGEWNGDKQYLLCAHCHNPHNPKYVLKEDKVNYPGFGDGKPLPPPAVPLGKGGNSAAPKGH